jgi:integrase
LGTYLRGRWWWYRRTIDKHDYRVPLKLHKGQESMLSARIKQMDDKITADHYGLPIPDQTTKLSEYVKAYLKRKAHKKSLDRDEQRLDYIQDVWPDLPLAQYRRTHIDDLERQLKGDGLKPATVNRYMELVRHLFNCAIEDGILSKNPLAHYEPYVEDGTRRALADDEIKAVFAALEPIKANKRFGPMRFLVRDLMLFALVTGMRLSEILNLRRDHIHDDTIALPMSATKSRRRGTPSKQRYKVVALNDTALGVIGRQPETEDGYVFALSRRHPNIMFYISKTIRELSGVHDFTFHALRHTASTIISSQSSLATARAVLGHADIKTTLRYTHPGIDEQRASVSKLGTHISGLVGK